ncbi:trab domain-containing protein [Phtheirospermum japonicum]|uniref:Trab domain-containing protein n=1 Tax=Phtheirospermum japonicum TaxID=374723 RepID=A0A830BJT8_9LAMI|nr:trab domain-containing protein [Phtheirospermum japonicum]
MAAKTHSLSTLPTIHTVSMKASPSPCPILAPRFRNLHIIPLKLYPLKKSNSFTISSSNRKSASSINIPSPPPNFNFKNEILNISTAAIAETHPELLDLAKNGTLVMIEKSQYGPVPPWRSDFAEPEAIWIIGTNHISRESTADVERVISAVRPDNVVVELCRSRQVTWAFFELFFRAGIMYTPENGDQSQQLRSSVFSLTGTGFFGAIGRSINLGGQTALALRLLLATFSSKVSSDINRPFGDEFRAARKVSEEIGAQLVLGDRPIEITLERAWSSLNWKEKLNLVSSVIRGITSSDDLYNKATEEPRVDDSSFQLYEQLSFSYPSLLPPLIYERDTFIAWSLKRSKAVNKSKKVVGVIGKGHMNGVIYSLVSDTGNLRFSDLAGKRSANKYGFARSIAKDLLRDTIIGVLLWLLYEQFKSTV